MNNQDGWQRIRPPTTNTTLWMSQVQTVFLEEFMSLGADVCPE